MDVVLVVAGIVLLLFGGDLLVAAAVKIARRLGIDTLTVGIVVVGVGTSLPELLTSVDAALQDSSAIAIGNVVGSNIANILLVLGLSALWAPLTYDVAPMRRDLVSLAGACGLVTLVLYQTSVERWMGLGLVIALAIYLTTVMRHSGITSQPLDAPDRDAPLSKGRLGRHVLQSGVGIVMLMVGAHLLVVGAIGLAQEYGVTERVIGLSLVSIGTSLPELAAAIMSIARRQTGVAVGNIIGSTLFNLLGILGVTALVTPLPVPQEIVQFDLWVMLGAVLALAVFARTGWRINRAEGGALLIGYPVYLAFLFA